jgi:hypothetical protein
MRAVHLLRAVIASPDVEHPPCAPLVHNHLWVRAVRWQVASGLRDERPERRRGHSVSDLSVGHPVLQRAFARQPRDVHVVAAVVRCSNDTGAPARCVCRTVAAAVAAEGCGPRARQLVQDSAAGAGPGREALAAAAAADAVEAAAFIARAGNLAGGHQRRQQQQQQRQQQRR